MSSTTTTPSEKVQTHESDGDKPASHTPVAPPQTPHPRKSRWFALVVPVVFILITASSHHITLRDLSPLNAESAEPMLPTPAPVSTVISQYEPLANAGLPLHDPWHHKRQAPTPASAASDIAFPTAGGPSSSAAASTTTLPPYQQALPTVPASPPAQPSPFPEPLDTVTQDFSTVGCEQFIEGLASSSTLQACVPFSLLLQTSNGFISTQNNLTDLNAVIYSSCNPSPSLSQCISSIQQLAASLQSACKTDLANNIPQATGALTALLAYPTMQQAACTVEQTTDAYCYVTAVHSQNPSDLYFYQLPLGISIPNNTAPSCSGCTKSVMAIYAEAAQAGNLSALAETYDHAAAVAASKCGEGYATQVAATTTSSARAILQTRLNVWVLMISGMLASAVVSFVEWS